MDINQAITNGRKRKLALKFYTHADEFEPTILEYPAFKDLIDRNPDSLYPWYDHYLIAGTSDPAVEENENVHQLGKTTKTMNRGWSVIGRNDKPVTADNTKTKREKIQDVSDALNITAQGNYENLYENIVGQEQQEDVKHGGDFDAEYVVKEIRPVKRKQIVDLGHKEDVVVLARLFRNGELSRGEAAHKLRQIGMRPGYIAKLLVPTLNSRKATELYTQDMVDQYSTDFVNRRPTRTVSDKRVKNLLSVLG